MRPALLAVFLTACWTQPSAPLPPVPPTPVAAGPGSASPSGARAVTPLPTHTIWRGVYQCDGGDIAAQLTLDLLDGGRVIAIFEYGPVATNPDVAPGAYRLIGHLDQRPDGLSMHLYPDRWISQPDGQDMAQITGNSDARRRHMTGRVILWGCGVLQVDLVE